MPLQFKFTPNKKDYIQASRLMAFKTPLFVLLAVVVVIIIVGSLIGLVFQLFTDSSWNNVALVSLLVGAFYVFYYFVMVPAQLTKTINKNETLQKERTFIFDENEVQLVIGAHTSRFSWEHFVQALKGRTMYILVYEEDKKVYPFIPNRAFADPGSEQAFLAILDQHGIPVK